MSSQSVCILCVDSKIVHTSRVPGLGHCTVAPNNTGQQHSPFFFLAHEGKYLILIELLTLKSNMQAVFLRRPQFFSGIQFKCERNVYIYILHTLFTLPKMCGLLISFCAWHLEIPLYRPTIVKSILALHCPWCLFSKAEIFWWKLSPCSSLTVPRLSGKKFRWESKKCILRDILHTISWYDCNSSPTVSR